MTRELKLALIVGFALVLLVTVLISDHLSKARKAQLAGGIEDAPSGVIASPNQPANEPIVTIMQGTGGGVQGPMMIGPTLNDPNAALVMKDPTADQAVVNGSAVRGGEVVRELPPMVSTGKANLTNGLQPEMAVVSQVPVLPVGAGDAALVNPIGGAVLPNLAPDVMPEVQPVGTSIATHVTPEAKPAADERWHTVVSGDSAYSIAKKYYGKGEYWTKLKEVNGDRIGAKGQMRLGVKVRIPDPASIGLKGVEMPKATNSTKPRETRIADAAPKKSGPREYTVKRGDTLGQISQKQLGSSKRADEILKMNKDLRNPNALREGMKLRLPAA